LMKSASEVVRVVQRYSTYLDERRNNNNNINGIETESVLGDSNEIEELLQNIGMVSPVTRLTAGRIYYHQLARQVIDILLINNRLMKLGGMISLPDLYCVVNRARGTELLSPEDLFKACSMMNSLHLGIVFKSFPSGVLVLQLSSLTDDKLFDEIISAFFANDNGVTFPRQGVNISTAAMMLHLSVVVTKEVLLEAERRTILCRDENIDGLYFFVNRFMSI